MKSSFAADVNEQGILITQLLMMLSTSFIPCLASLS